MRSLVLVLGLVVLLCSVAGADSGWWSECIDGQLHIWMYRYELNGRVLTQMRPIFEGLGWKVDWNPRVESIVATRGEDEIRMQIGNEWATVNGQAELLPAAPRRSYGAIYVPLRYIAEKSGAKLEYLTDNLAYDHGAHSRLPQIGGLCCIVITQPEGKMMVVHLI